MKSIGWFLQPATDGKNPFGHLTLQLDLEYDLDGECNNLPAEHTLQDFEKAIDYCFGDFGHLTSFQKRTMFGWAPDVQDLQTIWQRWLSNQQVYYRPDLVVYAAISALEAAFDTIKEEVAEYGFNRYQFGLNMDKHLEKVLERVQRAQEKEAEIATNH